MSVIIKALPPEPRRALVALAWFRFLTAQQFVRLGVAASDTVMRDYVFARLEKRARPLAKSRKIGSWLPKVHYLTKHGAEELADLYRLPIEEFPYPKGQVQFGELFARHRFAQVDFHIGLVQWLQHYESSQLKFAHMDFDIAGSRRGGDFKKASEIVLPDTDRPVIADGIFGIETPNDLRLYVLEIHRTTQTKAVGIQIKRYMDVLESGAVSFKYGVQSSPTICSVHMKDNVLKGVKTELMNTPDFTHFKEAFVFNTAEQLAVDFSEGWTLADDTPANPFPPSPTRNPLPLIE